MKDLQVKCLRRAEEVYAIANTHFNRNFKRIPIVFSNKLTKTGGYFQFSRSWIKQEQGNGAIKIQLSNSILRLNPEQFIADVVGHEIAHHIVHEVHGVNEQAHGRRWKQVMALFGQEANRCHSMKTETANKFKYNVNGKILHVGKVRHNRIQNGTASYIVRGKGEIKAHHWMEKPILNVEPRHTRPHTIMPKRKATGSKADIVRQQIRNMKAAGWNLQQCMATGGHCLRDIAAAANMKEGLCRTYIKNNWSKA